MTQSVVVFGGLGFVGSHITRHLFQNGLRITVVDGLISETGGDENRLNDIAAHITLLKQNVREFPTLANLIQENDIVIDAMGWTQHLAAFDAPFHDMELNLACHTDLAIACAEAKPKLILYLGSTGQYGRPPERVIEENTPFRPLDIQGIHKSAADHFWQVIAKRNGLKLICLRFGNTFGPGQPTAGKDIGLIGDFIRTLFNRVPIRIFGSNRSRNILFVEDLGLIVSRLISRSDKPSEDHLAINIAGHRLTIKELANKLIATVGSGTLTEEEMPEEIARLDTGYATIQEDRLVELLGFIQYTPLDVALAQTVEWFHNELAMQLQDTQ